MSGETWTPLKVVQWATGWLKEKGVGSARLDAELLVAHVLGTDRMGVYLHFDRPLDAAELEKLRGLIRRRAERVPVAYLLGWRDFYRQRFEVTPDVLIPRPETELLVESALGRLAGLDPEKRRVLDLGTGSGCVAISIASAMTCWVWAVDVSAPALAVARRNAERLGAAVEFREGDWFSALTEGDPRRFSVIVTNPPYVMPEDRDDLEPEVLCEPEGALFARPEGFEAYRRIAQGLEAHLEEEGRAYVELNAKYADNIAEIFKSAGFQSIRIMDIQGLPRVLELQRD